MPFLYSTTILLSAFLLFQIQLITARYILPWFGGGSSIWTTCLLFFQVLLPCGYLYSHLIKEKLSIKSQCTLHITLLFVSLYFLPVIPDESFKPTDFSNPLIQILLLLFSTVGLPYFLVSTSAPLIQHWFHLSQPNKSPFRLYALSNFGSLLGLISYPFCFEPFLTLETQSIIWSTGFILFTILCSVICFNLFKLPQGINSIHKVPLEKTKFSEDFVYKIIWIGLAACGSLILLSTTEKITKNVAAIPLFWVIPLSLYLISFILSFDHPRWYQRKFWITSSIMSLIATCAIDYWNFKISLLLQLIVYCLNLMAIFMICHGELARLKPHSSRLTTYYLCIGVGGALGSIFVSIVSPLIFDNYWEFSLSIIVSYYLVSCIVTLRKSLLKKPFRRGLEACLFWIIGSCLLFAYLLADVSKTYKNLSFSSRNFYGTLFVKEKTLFKKIKYRALVHGNIIHGTQFKDGPRKKKAASYYSAESAIGSTFQYFRKETPQKNLNIGVIGLGCGTMAAYGQAGDLVKFYEINNDVLDISKRYFSYIKNSLATIDFAIGDGRILLEEEIKNGAKQNFDLLLMDAFSSDSIPIHLLTKEAFKLYWEHLKPNGILAINATNRYIDLEPIIQTIAKTSNKTAIKIEDQPKKLKGIFYGNSWLLISTNKEFLNYPPIKEGILPIINNENEIHWTDDFSDLFSILKFD